MKNTLILFYAVFLIFSSYGASRADELSDLLNQVEKLNITIKGYTLGRALSQEQKTKAAKNIINDPALDPETGIYKFKHENLYVTADKLNHRVIIIYEQYEKLPYKKMQDIVGNLFFIFGDPTVMAHEKIIYWAYDNKGRISENKFRSIKDNKEKLQVLAYVKLNSDTKIMELKNSQDNNKGDIYYIISSDPVLKLIKSRQAEYQTESTMQ
ncbi:Uncharacterized protein dnl_39250 [Desulfonema limicola]|uniref:Outer membrane lipoprotein-sorting protein n=1 Tax=Desulfonema limicola TaxID=45656 RepID=A0A975B9U3_9BACT|nr:hypothetical protein [Desulfonema limicola]QTA81586.1 Uncharacterized protein dnl_39250 [Desulfonema limicola]